MELFPEVEGRFNRWLGQRYRQGDAVGFSTSAAVLLLGSFHSWSVDNIAHTAISLISGLAFVLLLAVQHLRPDLFLNLRQYALVALYALGHLIIAGSHRLTMTTGGREAGWTLSPAPGWASSPGRAFLLMLVSKWLFSAWLYVAIRLRCTASTLTLYFFCAIALAVGACDAYDESTMDCNPYVQSLTQGVNAMLGFAFRCGGSLRGRKPEAFMPLQEFEMAPSEGLGFQGQVEAAVVHGGRGDVDDASSGVCSVGLTPRQCMVTLWLAVQGVAFWAHVLMGVALERRERQQFVLLQKKQRGGSIPRPAGIGSLLGCMAIYHVYVCWMLIVQARGLGLAQLLWVS